MKMQDQNSADY
jgi:hypothetical protein